MIVVLAFQTDPTVTLKPVVSALSCHHITLRDGDSQGCRGRKIYVNISKMTGGEQ